MLKELTPDLQVDKNVVEVVSRIYSGEITSQAVAIGSASINFSNGGLHTVKGDTFVGEIKAEGTTRIMDIDATSFYPHIVLGFIPEDKLEGKFIAGYEYHKEYYAGRVKARVDAKFSGDNKLSSEIKNEINILTGNLNNYAPDVSRAMRCLGQLFIADLVARLVKITGVDIINVNTDGVLIKYDELVHQDVLDAGLAWSECIKAPVTFVDINYIAQANQNKYYAENVREYYIINNKEYNIKGASVKLCGNSHENPLNADDYKQLVLDAIAKKSGTTRNNKAVATNNTTSNNNDAKHDKDALVDRLGDYDLSNGKRWQDFANVNDWRYKTISPQAVAMGNKKYIETREHEKRWGDFDPDKVAGFGVVVQHPFIGVDIDNQAESLAVYNYIKDHNLKCWIMKSRNGIHCYFRMPIDFNYRDNHYTNAHHDVLGGLNVEYKVDGKQQLALKFGNDRPFIYGTEFSSDDLDELPLVLKKTKRVKSSGYGLVGLSKGCRDNTLTSYKGVLYSVEEIEIPECYEILKFVNDYLFVEPLPDNEMTKFANPSSYEGLERKGKNSFWNGKTFLSSEAGKACIKEANFLPTRLGEFPLVYMDGYYQNDEFAFVDIVNGVIGTELERKHHEAVAYVINSIIANDLNDKYGKKSIYDINPDEYIINIKNGRLNLLTSEFTEHTPDCLDTQRNPLVYNPEYIDTKVDEILLRTFEGDNEKLTLFYEVLGTCLCKTNVKFNQMFFLLGEGANGKSTLIKLIQSFVGDDNVSHISPQALAKDFAGCNIHGKQANIIEELNCSDEKINDTGLIKQIASGNEIQVNRKNKGFITFKPYATCIFACNRMPDFADKTKGMERRRIILECTADFDNSNSDFGVYEYLTSEDALSHLLNRSLQALQAMLQRSKGEAEYTIPASSVAAEEKYKYDTDIVRLWVGDYSFTSSNLANKAFTTDGKAGVWDLFNAYQKQVAGPRDQIAIRSFKERIVHIFPDLQYGKISTGDHRGKHGFIYRRGNVIELPKVETLNDILVAMNNAKTEGELDALYRKYKEQRFKTPELPVECPA